MLGENCQENRTTSVESGFFEVLKKYREDKNENTIKVMVKYPSDYSGKTHAAMMRTGIAANRSRAEQNPFRELKSKIDELRDTKYKRI